MIQDKIFFDEKDPTGLSYNTPFTFYGSYQGRLWSKSPSGSIQYYTQNSDLSAYATTGSNQFSGSQTITGSLTVTGGVTGTATTASYVEYANVANKPALISGSAQIASFGYATTGSNGFSGSQSITGSLTVTGQVVAQTLNVQQVTSSIVYSSGSNVFGNSLGNTQQFTGSVGVTGSLTVAGAGTFAGPLTGSSAIFTGAITNQQTNISADGAGVVLQGYVDNTLRIAVRGSGYNDGSRGGLLASTGDFGSNITATGNLNLQGAVTRNINFYDSSNTNINAQIQYDQISSTSGQLFFGTNNAGTFATRLTISNTGAATFSSSVTADSLIIANNDARIRNNDATGRIILGNSSTNTFAIFYGTSHPTNANQTVFANGGVTTCTFSSTGAATFSSSVTANGISSIGQEQAFTWQRTTGTASDVYSLNADSSGAYLYNNTTAKVLTYWDEGGNVGIGTASPFAKLEVVGGNNLPPSTGTQNYTIALRDPTSMIANVGGSILFQGFKTSTSAIGNFAYIAGKKENGTAGNEAGYLSIGTFDSSGIPAEQMRITSGGNVGIGTTSPASSTRLMVAGGIGFGNTTDGTANLVYGGRISAKQTSVTGGGGATLIHRGLGSVAYFILVSGLHSGNRFVDLIYGTGTVTINVLASSDVGTSTTRTYSMVSENLYVSLSGGAVWTVTTTGLGAMES